ncbi:hypothetical protein EFL25_13315 [Enterococcus faecium]|nr:hypothetical protein [Enterococcus faecium]EME8148076.1 hypothetical protein [Enterococcus faecium]
MFTDSQKIFSLSIVTLFFSLFLTNLINGMPNVKNIHYMTQIPKILLFFMFLIGFFCLLKNLTKQLILFSIISASIIALNFLFPNNLTYFKTTSLAFLTSCLPITLFSMALYRWDYLYSYFVKASYLVSLMIIYTYTTGLLSFGDKLYSMGFSYSSILFFLILFDNYFKSKKLLSLVFSVPILVLIILYGSRGAMACIAIYILIYIYRSLFFHKKKLQAFSVITFSLLLFLMRDNLIHLLLSITTKLGIYSRTLTTIASGTFTTSLGREDIYSQVLSSFMNNPFKIRGINADYALTGIYSHNFILELLYEFGSILGVIIVLLIIITILLTLHNKGNGDKTHISLLLISIWVPYLLISSTIWVTPFFWLFLGIFLNQSDVSLKRRFFVVFRSN